MSPSFYGLLSTQTSITLNLILSLLPPVVPYPDSLTPPGTLGNVWRHCWSSQEGAGRRDRCHWNLGMQDSPSTKNYPASNGSSAKGEKLTMKSNPLIGSFKARCDLATSSPNPCQPLWPPLAMLSFYASLTTPSRAVSQCHIALFYFHGQQSENSVTRCPSPP